MKGGPFALSFRWPGLWNRTNKRVCGILVEVKVNELLTNQKKDSRSILTKLVCEGVFTTLSPTVLQARRAASDILS